MFGSPRWPRAPLGPVRQVWGTARAPDWVPRSQSLGCHTAGTAVASQEGGLDGAGMCWWCRLNDLVGGKYLNLQR